MTNEDNESRKKKILIIGAGVSGLTAGIYGQKNGFETVIYEKNKWIGGSCSGWKRGEYTIDNCIHWLTGTRKGTADYEMWKELGVLDDDVPVVQRPWFMASEAEGVTVTLWRDINRTRNEMLKISPDDALEINNFLDCVEFFADLMTSGMSAKEIYFTLKHFNDSMNVKRMDFTRHIIKYLGMNSLDMGMQFKHPAIQSLFIDFMAKEYESYWLMLAYSFFITDNGDLPQGGSIGMIKSLKEKYLSLGGKIYTNCPVKQILVNKKIRTPIEIPQEIILKRKSPKKVLFRHATAILFENGNVEAADYIIPACDINFTFKNLLCGKFTPGVIKRLYKHPKKLKKQLYSSFQVAFSVDGLFECVEDTLIIDCNPIQIGYRVYSRLQIKNYKPYGDYIAPEGKTVIQVSVPQYERDFNYWEKAAGTKGNYKEFKAETAERIQKQIERRFPEYKGKLAVIDVWTPHSYYRLNNDFMGAYMRYMTTPFSFAAFIPAEIFGLDNVVLASHYLKYPGGLPTAAYGGRDAIDIIKKNENVKKPIFNFSKK